MNGQSIGPLAYKLNHQDVIEVADVKISFLMTAWGLNHQSPFKAISSQPEEIKIGDIKYI